MKKYLNEKGEVAVLYSPEFGAGWSTWNMDSKECIFDPFVVQWVLNGKKGELPNLYGNDFCYLGQDQLEIKWMKPGTEFMVCEHDGHEYFLIKDDAPWVVA